MLFAACDLLIDNHSIKSFLRGLGNQLFSQRDMLLPGEAHPVDDLLLFPFRLFNSLANLNLLLASQQRNASHLLHVHPNWIIQDVQPAWFLLFFRLGGFRLLNLCIVNDFNFEAPKPHMQLVNFLRRYCPFRKYLIDVVCC